MNKGKLIMLGYLFGIIAVLLAVGILAYIGIIPEPHWEDYHFWRFNNG